jgi:glycine/D-amino acid oxidase-like deaminating enzyme
VGARALVIGAGIIGAAIADRLQSAGWTVVLFEPDIPGGGATAAGMGHVLHLEDSPEQLAFTARGVALWRAEPLPAACAREDRGTLWVAQDPAELEEARTTAGRWTRLGLTAEVLDPVQLRAAEPSLRPDLAGALRVPDDQILYPPAAARHFLDRALARGAQLVREPVRALEPGGVRTGTGRHAGDAVILAAGLGCTALLPELDIVPRKGHLAITGRVPGLVRHQVMELGYARSAHSRDAASAAFNVQPRATGQLLIGSTREFSGLDPAFNRALLARMLERAVAFLPPLAQVPIIRVWTGFRPCGAGNLPSIGPWPGRPGLFVAAGHEGIGITTALVTAELMAHHLLGTPTGLDPAPFLPTAAESAHG